MKALDGYVRVSRVGGRQGESFISPDVQEQQILAWAKSRGVRVNMLKPELDQSGSKTDRPIFNEALTRVEGGESGGIVVAKLDRFARTLMGALEALRRIDEAGGEFVSVAEGFDPTTPMGKAMMRVALIFAELELDRIRDGWNVAQQAAVARGVHFGGRAIPYGYRREGGDALQVVPELVPVVREVFGRRARRESAWTITDWLNENHPREDGINWTEGKVEHLWRNRVYLGEAFHGDHRNPEAHDPIVSPSEFAAANAVTGGSGRPTRENPPLLGGGLLRCAGCRYAMQAGRQKQRDGSVIDVYRCRKKHGGGDCTEPATVTAHKIEPEVIAFVLTLTGMSSWEEQTDRADQVEALEVDLAHAQRRRSDFLADHELRERIARDAYLAEAERLEAEVTAAQGRLDAERVAQGSSQRARHVLIEDWLAWDSSQRSDALRQVLDSVYVRRGRGSLDGRVQILAAGTDEFERPVRGGTDYVTAPIPWPEQPEVDPNYEPEPSAEAKARSVSLDGLRAALADYPDRIVAEVLGISE